MDIQFLALMLLSRECDRREAILFRQGRIRFTLPGAGHEALAIMSRFLGPKDTVFPHYRDRALLLSMGATAEDMAASAFALRESSGAGRQYPGHFSDRSKRVFSCASPTGLQCLPACGAAWASLLKADGSYVVCTLGDATTRQGEFFEAWAFALERALPIVFLVENNGYGISTPTEKMDPRRIGMLLKSRIIEIDGRDSFSVATTFEKASTSVRTGQGPIIVWASVDRLLSHASSDDQTQYRSEAELVLGEMRDPIKRLSDALQHCGDLSKEQYERMSVAITKDVESAYMRAEGALRASSVDEVRHNVLSQLPSLRHEVGPAVGERSMRSAINITLQDLLSKDPRVIIFGEDIEDPKGGVFGLTRGLSTAFPNRVTNSPLAEATIVGVAAGISALGMRPIVELQFIDFVGPAFNQIANQIATLRWRTNGDWSCPLVIMAPCGSSPGGGPWHSQTNEGWFAHIPGLSIVVPSNPSNAAALLRACAASEDPVLFLIPKQALAYKVTIRGGDACRIGESIKLRSGADITIIAWGNAVRWAIEAAQRASLDSVACDVIDLQSLVPFDWPMVVESLEKTGRLIVVQEDARSCSFGQAIIAELTSNRITWQALKAAPILITREDLHVAYDGFAESLTVPNSDCVASAIETLMATSV